MPDDVTRKRVLANIVMMRLLSSELAPVFSGARPSKDDPDWDVIVGISPYDESSADRVKAVMPEARIRVREEGRPRRA